MFGPVGTRLDLFWRIRIRLEAFRCVWKHLTAVGFFFILEKVGNLINVAGFWIGHGRSEYFPNAKRLRSGR